MSHRHFCDFAGHEWECSGTALRPLAGHVEPSKWICLLHHVSMDDGDHSECPIELLACPEHREEQLAAVGVFAASDPSVGKGPAQSDMFKDTHGNPIVGFCLWCDQNFYSIEEVETHNKNGMAACPEFQEFKGGC
jgi:hypothetical protein